MTSAFAMLIGSGIIIGCCLYRTNPATLMIRFCLRCLALSYLIREMIDGAWERRHRYEECLDRARREI